jgi:hypothetical protein
LAVLCTTGADADDKGYQQRGLTLNTGPDSDHHPKHSLKEVPPQWAMRVCDRDEQTLYYLSRHSRKWPSFSQAINL